MRIDRNDWEMFQRGEHFQIYTKLGTHPYTRKGHVGTQFDVWAPEATSVSVIGEFNGWNPEANVMEKVEGTGFWELRIPHAKEGQMFKYEITTKDGRQEYKADPFCFSMERRPGTASVIDYIRPYRWSDDEWIKNRCEGDIKRKPMFVYEVHLGSWIRHKGNRERNPEGFFNYRDLVKKLADYVIEMGYTHVELIGIAEYQNDFSWGYQVTNPFAVNSRYGKPRDLMYLVNYLHKRNVGVIMDWVPAHYSKDRHGLKHFDGSCLFEPADREDHPIWGTKVYDFSKGEVQSYLISNAIYWLKEFHMDGIRVDAVDSMIHLDFGRQPMKNQDNHNYDAIDMLKRMNQAVRDLNAGAFTVAEESTAHEGMTDPEGMGFTFKWNMGWEHDFLEYLSKSPEYRKEKRHHNKVNYSMVYAFDEVHMLVFSHDNFGHANPSLYGRMKGKPEERMSQLRGIYMYMMCHPGKKLLFMGQDFGQEQNWSVSRPLDWPSLRKNIHKYMKAYMKELIHFYLEHRALFDNDLDWTGFDWVNADDSEHAVFSFERHSFDGSENFLCVFNFANEEHKDYRVGVREGKKYTMLFNSQKIVDGETVSIVEEIEADGRKLSISSPLMPYEAVIYKYE